MTVCTVPSIPKQTAVLCVGLRASGYSPSTLACPLVWVEFGQSFWGDFRVWHLTLLGGTLSHQNLFASGPHNFLPPLLQCSLSLKCRVVVELYFSPKNMQTSNVVKTEQILFRITHVSAHTHI